MDLSKNAITALFGMWRRGFNDPHDPPKIWELSDRKITVVFGETPCLVIKMIEPTDKKGIWSIEFHFLVKDSPTAEDSRQDAVIVVDHRLGEKPKRYINYRNWAKIIRPDTEESFKKIKSMTEECNELQAA